MLEDAHRFTLFHKRAIESAPLQVYAAALVFSPSQSRVRELFIAEEPEWILVKPHAETRWPASLNILEGHTGEIRAIVFSHDSSLVASGSEDNTIRLWRTSTGDCIQELKGHHDTIRSVAFSHDTKLLASGSKDNTVRLWRVGTGGCLHILEGHTSTVRSVIFSFNSVFIASASNNDTIRLWHADSGNCVQELQNCHWIFAIAFSRDSSLLASASHGGLIRLWDVDTGNLKREFDLNWSERDSVAFSHDLALIAAFGDMIIEFWSMDTGELVRDRNCGRGFVYSMAFSPNSNLIALASGYGSIIFRRVDTGRVVRELEINETDGQLAAFSYDLSFIAVPWMGKTIRLWRADADSDTQEQEASITSIAFSPNSALVASASADNGEMFSEFDISLWCAETGRRIQNLGNDAQGCWSIAFSHDSMLLGSISGEDILIWRTDTGDTVQSQPLPAYAFICTFLHDSGFIAAASGSEIYFYRIETDPEWDSKPDCRASMHQHITGEIASIAFSHDSELVAIGSSDKTIQIFCVVTDAHVQTLRGHMRSITSIAFSQDSALVASASRDGAVRLWRVDTGECLQNICIGAASTNLSITSDGSQVLTDFGYIAIDGTAVSDAQISAHFSGLGVRYDYSWITWNNHNILRLPAALGACCSTISASTVAIGCTSGRVIILRFSTEELSKIYNGFDNNRIA